MSCRSVRSDPHPQATTLTLPLSLGHTANLRSVVFVGGIGILFKIFISSAIALNKLA